MPGETAVIIGAGPAGLTAAYELLARSEIKPLVLEKSEYMGGIARTVVYKGNRIDIGPHRFFSKSDRVMEWWLHILPLQATDGTDQQITYQQKSRTIHTSAEGPDPTSAERVMLTLKRKTRIYYNRKFFDYPVSLKWSTLRNLGLMRTVKIGCSYVKSLLLPIRPEENLEHFMINRFGRELYLTFFKEYTEKVWGIACDKISADWGAQRIKGLSITKALQHAAKRAFSRVSGDIKQKQTETSLVEQFLFPKFGTGQMWEEVARQVTARGGEILIHHEVTKLIVEGNRVTAIEALNTDTNEKRVFAGEYFFSTMPIKELVRSLTCEVPPGIREISEGLVYRDFVEVGLLVNTLKVSEDDGARSKRLISDNWLYIQEPNVLVGRIQIWNNWGPAMVADHNKVWLGLEYFCNEFDDLWNLPDEQMINLAAEELERIGIADKAEVSDGLVIRMCKTYPGYFGTYARFDELRQYLDSFANLFLIGRNGQHKYNNQDHSMLAAMVAVDNIIAGVKTKDDIWAVNTEMEYHEEKFGE